VDPQGQLEELGRHLDISLIQLQKQRKLPFQEREGSLVLQLNRLVEVEFLSSSEEVLLLACSVIGSRLIVLALTTSPVDVPIRISLFSVHRPSQVP
jgi:hypothetical protein